MILVWSTLLNYSPLSKEFAAVSNCPDGETSKKVKAKMKVINDSRRKLWEICTTDLRSYIKKNILTTKSKVI